MNSENLKKLLIAAKKLQLYAYTPYSNFKVAAIVGLKNNQQIGGVNVENAAYNAGICGERTALSQVFAQGFTKNDIEFLFLITDSNTIGYPCGVCRQFMVETMPQESWVYISNKNPNNDISSIIKLQVKELLPYSFNRQSLKGE